ncbi:MAG: hypothetical protein NZ929_01055 [Aigarchaeota archaeon]|nr:hypothetical protein [Aigarchaeota archaeon]MCX8192244.1 hypothetical protein [Nitrososphaeria archaeon]MDW7986148.1 hypothetical protein [Nitrososphaerota archaeon]
MSREVYDIRGYVTSVEPVVKRGLLSYRVRIISLGEEVWNVYLREISKDFRLGSFVKVKLISSRQREEEKLVADEVEILEDVHHLKIEESLIEEVSREGIPVVTGWKSGRFFSSPILDEELIKKIPKELPAKVITIFIETSKGVKLASIISEKEYKILLRTEELLKSIEENEKRSEKYCKEQLELLEI